VQYWLFWLVVFIVFIVDRVAVCCCAIRGCERMQI
jgi:hypothetical protein